MELIWMIVAILVLVSIIATGAGVVLTLILAAILFSVLAPAYQDYTTKAHISEAIQIAKKAAERVIVYNATNGRMPVSLRQTGYEIKLPSYLEAVGMITPGTIYVRFSNKASQIDGGVIGLFPQLHRGEDIKWRCGSANIAIKHLPKDCRDESIPGLNGVSKKKETGR